MDLLALGLSLADCHAGNWYISCKLQQAKAAALAVLNKLKSLPRSMAELFANAFAKGTDNLLAQQDNKLASRKDFPLMLPKPLVEETPLIYKRGRRRAITGLEIAEEKERDALRQRCCNKRAAAILIAADKALAAREEEKLLEAAWVADKRLQLSQLSCLNASKDQQSPSSSDAAGDAADNKGKAGLGSQLGSQGQPVKISSSNKVLDCESDNEPRRSSRVERSTRAVESQQQQTEHGIIPAPSAKARARALNKKKRQNTMTSQLDHEYKLV